MGTQGGWEEAEERGTVEEREEKRNTGSNRVSLVFQHPPRPCSSSVRSPRGRSGQIDTLFLF